MLLEQRPATVLIVHDQAEIRTGRKTALESAGFRVVEVENHTDAPPLLRDAGLGIDLLITRPDFPGLQLATEADRQGLPIIITAEAAYPIGIHNTVAILLEPVCNTELISTACALLFGEDSPSPPILTGGENA
jgi:CheY-like chemotaxis protein